ncbi:unnamed protein product [Arctogadus glacialis]
MRLMDGWMDEVGLGVTPAEAGSRCRLKENTSTMTHSRKAMFRTADPLYGNDLVCFGAPRISSPFPKLCRDAEIKVKSPAPAAASSIHNVAVSLEDLSLWLSVEGRLQPGEEHRGDVPLWGGSRRAARGAKGEPTGGRLQ